MSDQVSNEGQVPSPADRLVAQLAGASKAAETTAEGLAPEATKAGQTPAQQTQTEVGEQDSTATPEVKRLRAEAANYRTQLREAEARVKEFEQSKLTEQEKLEQRATEAETRLQEYEAKAVRYEVAAEKGLPLSWASRLQGATKAEIEKDADTLAAELGASQTQVPNFDAGFRSQGQSEQGGMNSLIRQATGRR